MREMSEELESKNGKEKKDERARQHERERERELEREMIARWKPLSTAATPSVQKRSFRT